MKKQEFFFQKQEEYLLNEKITLTTPSNRKVTHTQSHTHTHPQYPLTHLHTPSTSTPTLSQHSHTVSNSVMSTPSPSSSLHNIFFPNSTKRINNNKQSTATTTTASSLANLPPLLPSDTTNEFVYLTSSDVDPAVLASRASTIHAATSKWRDSEMGKSSPVLSSHIRALKQKVEEDSTSITLSPSSSSSSFSFSPSSTTTSSSLSPSEPPLSLSSHSLTLFVPFVHSSSSSSEFLTYELFGVVDIMSHQILSATLHWTLE
jgi:hypothetical protein